MFLYLHKQKQQNWIPIVVISGSPNPIAKVNIKPTNTLPNSEQIAKDKHN
jgi:hypothetical protein